MANKVEIIEIKEAYEWIEEVVSTDKIPADHQGRVVLLMKDMHRRLKDLEEAEYERKHSSED